MKTQITKITGRTSDEKLVATRYELTSIIAEAKEQLDMVNGMLLIKVQANPEKKLTIGETTVSLVSRLNFTKVDLTVAKKYHAVKQVVDSDILKPLYLKLGDRKIPGVTTSEYILVRETK